MLSAHLNNCYVVAATAASSGQLSQFILGWEIRELQKERVFTELLTKWGEGGFSLLLQMSWIPPFSFKDLLHYNNF